jgi:hypothetical protein
MKKITFLLLMLHFLLIGEFSVQGQKFSYKSTNEGVMIKENGENVLFYQKKTKSQEGKFPRANYVHPLYGLDGEILTEDFPADHLHHRGIFWAWHQILLNNQKIADAWDCKNIVWKVRNTNYTIDNQSFRLDTEVKWQIPKNDSAKALDIIQENTQIIVHAKQKNYRIIDFVIVLKPLVYTLSIGGSEDHKGYGGFSLRLKLPENIEFIADNQLITPQDTAVYLGNYLTFQGDFSPQKTSYITLFCHPVYPLNSQAWILRKKGSMQNAVYPGSQAIPLLPKDKIELRYRLLIHQEKLDLKEIYADFLEEDF